jgi:uncharacterized protein
MLSYVFLALAGFAAGAINSLAGGGGFITFPALLFAGLPPVAANASGNIAVFPGIIASIWAYRRDIRASIAFNIRFLVLLSLLGGLIGALILLLAPASVFVRVLPWLMLCATFVFAFGNFAPARILRRFALRGRSVHAVQFILSVYSGYFGAGLGFMLLAALTFYGLRDIHAMNGLKLIFALATTVAAAVAFIIAGQIHWTPLIVVAVTALLGGYAGAQGAKRVDPKLVKLLIVALGCALTVYFFWHGA